jgi:hypothetical protein
MLASGAVLAKAWWLQPEQSKTMTANEEKNLNIPNMGFILIFQVIIRICPMGNTITLSPAIWIG